jgi:hypothetical protein
MTISRRNLPHLIRGLRRDESMVVTASGHEHLCAPIVIDADVVDRWGRSPAWN